MPTTPNYGFVTPPYTGEKPNGAAALLTLGNGVDTSLKAEETARIAGDAMVMSSRGHAATPNINNVTFTAVPYDTSVADEITWTGSTSNFWTTPTAGYYTVNAQVHFAANATGVRTIRIMKNGTAVAYCQIPAASGVGCGPSLSWADKLAAGDTIQIQVYQNSGGVLALAGGTAFNRADITRTGR